MIKRLLFFVFVLIVILLMIGCKKPQTISYFKLSEFDFPYETMPSVIKWHGTNNLIPALNPFRITCAFPFYISEMGGWRPRWWDLQQGRYYISEHESLYACDIYLHNAMEFHVACQYLPLYSTRYGIASNWFHFGIGDKMNKNIWKTRCWTYD